MEEGFVNRRPDSGPTAVAATPRCAVTDAGEIVCTYVTQAALGGNDFKPMLSRSRDGGRTWSPTRPTGTMGQSTGLGALPDGRALFVYNQRRHGAPGVRLAVCRPTEAGFGIELDELVWGAATRTQSESSGDHAQRQDFSFGEPSVTVLPEGSLLVAFWLIQPAGRGIGQVRLEMR